MNERDSRHGGVSGRAVDLDGRPLAAARVHARSADYDWLCATAGEDGRFQLDGLPAKPDTTVWVDAEGRARFRLHGVCVFPGCVVDLGDVALPSGRRVALRVVDDAGEPVVDASVRCTFYYRTQGHTVSQDGPACALRADASGHCVTPAFGFGECDIEVEASGYCRRAVEYARDASGPRIDAGEIVLRSTPLVFRGRVVDADGQPIPEASVYTPTDQDSKVRCDAEGRFRIECWDERVGFVYAEKTGYSTVGVPPDEDGGTRFTIDLDRAKWVHASVVDAGSHEPLPASSVSLCKVVRHSDGTTWYEG